MPRPPKPFFRKQTASWYCSVAGRQISLGKDRDAAHQKFHELMASREQLSGEFTTLYQISQAYLDWVERNRKPGTYRLHLFYLESFIGSVGKRLRPNQLKRHHVTKWYEELDVSTTTQSDAVGVVQRMLNWSVEEDHLDRNPIAGMRKPKRKRRDVFYTPEQWQKIKDRDHVWSYDFVQTRTHDGRPVRMLTVIDEFTRECLGERSKPSVRAKEKERGSKFDFPIRGHRCRRNELPLHSPDQSRCLRDSGF